MLSEDIRCIVNKIGFPLPFDLSNDSVKFDESEIKILAFSFIKVCKGYHMIFRLDKMGEEILRASNTDYVNTHLE